MLTKFTLLFTVTVTAISAFLFSVPPKSIAFNATIMAPVVVIDEAMPSPTTNTVSLNLSFDIHPQAMDLFEAVSVECQELYKVYKPLAMDIFETVSAEAQELFEKYQPVAMDLLQTSIRPLAMDLLDIISTEFQQLYKKYGAFCEDVSLFPYSLFAYGRIEVTAMSYDAASNRTCITMQTGPAPFLATTTNLSSSNVSSVPYSYSLFAYGRIEVTAVSYDAGSNRTCIAMQAGPAPFLATTTVNLISTNVTDTQIAHAPLGIITKNHLTTNKNAINLTKVLEGGIMVEMGTVAPSVTFKPQNMTCPLDQMNATSFAQVQVQKKNKSAMGSNNTASFTQKNSTAFTLDSKNITSSSLDSSKTNMISHENVTPTSAQDITPALPLDMSLEQAISVARDLFDALFNEEYYESFHELVLGCIRTHFSFAAHPLEMATNLPKEMTPSTNSSSRYEDDSQDHGNNNNSYYSTTDETSDHEYTMEELLAANCFFVMCVILLFGGGSKAV
eukprot:CAMPEP_0113647570 /NCGR_PEP_ID=MMETSP0017_2-20120614/25191_1 /TAXON_ID=2856 /ORGANISM="Cylindrotheca closterium" /LENGTH=501 /DNA_ID=CAMNT_0000559655 /DNA_START=168 /DNA_END=1673 /DNA_ORIENTATION=- /assembly_acc=CAM_ASM_000147